MGGLLKKLIGTKEFKEFINKVLDMISQNGEPQKNDTKKEEEKML